MQSYNQIILEQQKCQYFIDLTTYLDEQYCSYTVYPPREKIFNAFSLTPFEKTHVVVLGQDPYYKPNQANGLAFSVNDGTKLPPSLKNIFKLIYKESEPPQSGDLTYLAEQGVLLLNTVLTVRAGEPNSHQNRGWELFTDHIIKMLNNSSEPIVFLLWGNNAIQKQKLLTSSNNLILTAPHPSPLSAYKGFFDCDHFNLTNKFLSENGIEEIEWCKKI